MDENLSHDNGQEPEPNDTHDKIIMRTVGIVLLIIFIFSLGNFTGVALKIKKQIDSGELKLTIPTAEVTASPETATSEAEAIQVSAETSESEPSNSETTAETTQATESQKNAAELSKAEIIEMYNSAANKVKPNAAKITRNFKKQQHAPEHTKFPEVAESVASPIVTRLLKDDNEPKVYDTPEAIKENFPLPNEDLTSKVTDADVTKAVCTEDSGSYTLTLYFIPGTDPVGQGVANAFSRPVSDDVTSVVKIIDYASFEFYDAVLTCKIDKATGNMTWANYHLPLTLTVSKTSFNISCSVGVILEDDYTIEY